MAGIGGGRSNFRLTPMKSDGATRAWDEDTGTDVIGGHAGDYAGLNVANPVPGMRPRL